MAQKKAQIGMELMLIVGLMMMLLLPLIYVVLTKTGDFSDKASVAKSAENAGRITAAANNIGRMGPGSNVTLDIEMPSGVTSIDATDTGEVVIAMSTRFGDTEIVKMSSFRLDITPAAAAELLRPGTHHVSIGYPYNTIDNRILISV